MTVDVFGVNKIEHFRSPGQGCRQIRYDVWGTWACVPDEFWQYVYMVTFGFKEDATTTTGNNNDNQRRERQTEAFALVPN